MGVARVGVGSSVARWLRGGAAVVNLAAMALVIADDRALAQSRCTSLKYKFAGKGALSKAKCVARAARTGSAVDPACLAAAEQKLSEKWAIAESKGDCASVGDGGVVQDKIDDFIASLTGCLQGLPTPTPIPTPTRTATGTATATATATPTGGPPPPQCCAFVEPSAGQVCLMLPPAICALFGGSSGSGDCDATTGLCGAPPVSTGDCCSDAIFAFSCLAGPGVGAHCTTTWSGTLHPGTTCLVGGCGIP